MSTNKQTNSNQKVQDSTATNKEISTIISDTLYPGIPGFMPDTEVPVGGVILAKEPIEYFQNRTTTKVVVRNTGDRPIQVGSHFHFFEVNRYMEFDRKLAFGYHLNIPATTAVRFEPGEQKEVELVSYGGKRRVIGFNNLVDGYTGDEDAPTYFPAKTKAFNKLKEFGFKTISEAKAESNLKNKDNSTSK
jgi:urease subunit beta